MPTRIILRENSDPVSPPVSPRSPEGRPSLEHRRSSSSLAATPSFRRAVKGSRMRGEDNESRNTDISSSSRLARYLYVWLCSVVMLVSVSQFYTNTDGRRLEEDEIESVPTQDEFLHQYKVNGAFVISAGAVFIYLVIILVHFDTVFCPDVWKKMFHNGSKGERNLLIILILYWCAGIYLCTSVLSVGAVQANVYFTTWIAFVSNLSNFNVWRISAGKRSWSEYLHSARRNTTYNWFWTMVFAFITSLAASDTYANREYLRFRYEGKDLNATEQILGLILAWVSVALCGIAIAGNQFLTREFSVSCCGKFETTLAFRQIEVCINLGILGLYGWVIFTLTGVNGIFSEPSSTYFGIFGTWFAAIATFGTWMKETQQFQLLHEQTTSSERTPQRQSVNQ